MYEVIILSYSKVEQLCFDLAEPIAAENGCYVYDVEYVKEGASRFLRIYADRDGGIGIDECETISRALSVELDKKDPIKENYFLEVSSPGIERKLKTQKHFSSCIGKKITLSFYKPFCGEKQIVCVLTDCEDDKIKINYEDEAYEIPLSDISLAKLYFEF